MALLTCENLNLGYEGRVILDGLSFSVNEGDYLCIVGENGSGKSTLMRTLLGLQKPLGGRILTGNAVKQAEIGYLPQQTAVQKDFPASVWEVVLSGCQNRLGLSPFYRKADKERAKSSLEMLDIASLANSSYKELSGGQQQRVLLARALCATKRMLLLDEPVTGLDPKASAELYRVIFDLNRKSGITVIMVSHDILSVLAHATHILHIGQEVFFGTRDAYLQSSVGRLFTEKGGVTSGDPH